MECRVCSVCLCHWSTRFGHQKFTSSGARYARNWNQRFRSRLHTSSYGEPLLVPVTYSLRTNIEDESTIRNWRKSKPSQWIALVAPSSDDANRYHAEPAADGPERWSTILWVSKPRKWTGIAAGPFSWLSDALYHWCQEPGLNRRPHNFQM